GLYRNDTIAPRLAVRLRGQAPNTAGIGAKITVRGGPVTQSQEMICGGRYLSSDEPLRVFAAGNASSKLTIEVAWRSGRKSVVRDVKPNCLYEIEEKSVVSGQLSVVARTNGPPTAGAQQRTTDHGQLTTLFQDVSDRVRHNHHDDPFEDFERQP